MKNIFYSVLLGLVSVVMIFNVLSGIVGGLWLVLIGGIGLVIAGIIAGFIMPWIYSIAMLPSMGLLALTVRSLEKGHLALASILGFLGSFWEKSIIWIWVAVVFFYFVSQSNHFPPIALILSAYAAIMAPLQYMASQEEYASGGNAGAGTTFGLFYAQFVFLIFVLAWLFGFSPVGLLWILTLLFAAIPVYIIIKSQEFNHKRTIINQRSKDVGNPGKIESGNTIATKKRILIIVDDGVIRDMYREVLEDAGFFVDSAQDGEEGLTKMLEGSYDLITLKIILPKISGLDVLKQFKKSGKKHGKIVLIDNLYTRQLVKEAFMLGIDGYEAMNFLKIGELPVLIQRYIDGSITKEQSKHLILSRVSD